MSDKKLAYVPVWSEKEVLAIKQGGPTAPKLFFSFGMHYADLERLRDWRASQASDAGDAK